MGANNQPRKVPDDILEQMYLTWADGKPLRTIAKLFDISLTTVSNLKKQKNKNYTMLHKTGRTYVKVNQ